MLVLSKADGYSDPFYMRFTTPKQNNLILGTSRSAQSLQPSIINNLLQKSFYNYSFTVVHSPYGPTYLNSIKKKLNPSTKNGIFIVTVDPWAISSNTLNPNDSLNFLENKLCLANTSLVNIKPNFKYLLQNLKGKYYTILTANRGSMYLHNDGWLEVSIPMDSISIKDRLDTKIKDYRSNSLPFYNFSTTRLKYLEKTIDLLKKHGKVYVVRLPVHPEIYKIDQELIPDLNEKLFPITGIADGYLDMTNENHLYQYTDGNHLHKESGKLVSIKIAEWIKNTSNTQ